MYNFLVSPGEVFNVTVVRWLSLLYGCMNSPEPSERSLKNLAANSDCWNCEFLTVMVWLFLN